MIQSMKKSCLIPMLLTSLLGQANASEKNWQIQPEASPVSFVAVGKPGFLKIKGEGAQLQGKAAIKENKISGDFEVALDSLKTGIELRDEHMKEKYLETKIFPSAKLHVDSVSFDPASDSIDSEFKGNLTIKGVEKPISGTLAIQGLSSTKAVGKAEFEIKISDYPIGVPSHLGVTVAESVKVSVQFSALAAENQHAQVK